MSRPPDREVPGQLPIVVADALSITTWARVTFERGVRRRCASCRIRRVVYRVTLGPRSTATAFRCLDCWTTGDTVSPDGQTD